jgi:hypothetical protein
MKKMALFAMLFLIIPSVLADEGMMSGFGMMGGAGMVGMGLVGLVYLAVGAFVFSVIFWLTHNWLVKGKKR